MLELKDVYVSFPLANNEVNEVLKGINLKVEKGDFISVLGMNGAGKSTLLNVISGALTPTKGKILLDGIDITNMPEHKRAKMIGRLFQDPCMATASHMSIEENLGLAYSRGKKRTLQKAITKKDAIFFKEQLARLQLGLEDNLKQKVGLLSGGQRQALTLLMATIVTPKLLLLDEHTAALDPATATKVMQLTQQIIQENKLTTLMITHNVKQALTYGNKTILLKDGVIEKVMDASQKAQCRVEEVLNWYSN